MQMRKQTYIRHNAMFGTRMLIYSKNVFIFRSKNLGTENTESVTPVIVALLNEMFNKSSRSASSDTIDNTVRMKSVGLDEWIAAIGRVNFNLCLSGCTLIIRWFLLTILYDWRGYEIGSNTEIENILFTLLTFLCILQPQWGI